MKVQAKAGLLISSIILIYTVLSFFLLRYLLKNRLGIDSVLVDLNLTQIQQK